MSDTSIPADWYRQGWLPALCARHGVPATTRVKRTFHTRTPGWVFLLLLISLLVVLAVSLAIRKSAAGAVPACDRCVSERRGYLSTVVGGWVVGLGLLVLGLSVDSGATAGVGVVVWLAALVLTLCGDHLRVRGYLRKDQTWVDLKGVSPEFAQELRTGLLRAQQSHQLAQQHATAGPTAPSPATAPSSARDILPGR